MNYIDFFPYFSSWSVHHQVDWLIANQLGMESPAYTPRIFSCSHYGRLGCAISRNFIPGSLNSDELCRNCSGSFNDYFDDFLHAEKPAHIIITDLDEITLDTIHQFSWFINLDNSIQSALKQLLSVLTELSSLSALTHFRISKQDIENKEPALKAYFSKTILLEALIVAHNWSLTIPHAVVLFNGRLAPYIAPWFLAKQLGIPTYIHERGTKMPFSIYFNEYPSTGMCSYSVLKRVRSLISRPFCLTDTQLISCLKSEFQELYTPSNYPDLFKASRKPLIDPKALCMHDVLYVVSSEDEADSYINSNLALAQRNAILVLVDLAAKNQHLSFAIKSHPNIYGVGGYPGMKYSAEFIDLIETAATSMANLTVYGREIHSNPFDLIDSTTVIIGLHSSLLQYAWFKGKYIITHPFSTSKVYASELTDFNATDSFGKKLIDLFSNTADLSWFPRITYDQLLYLTVKQFAFDIRLGPNVAIADDHFSPKTNIFQLKLLADCTDNGDLGILIQSIINSSDINLELLNERFRQFKSLT